MEIPAFNIQLTEAFNLYEKNMEVLTEYHPYVAEHLKQLSLSEHIQVASSECGKPIPLYYGFPLHSVEDPIREGEDIFSGAKITSQKRVAFFGFGFGYHILPFVKRGLSPVVIEPDPAVLKLACAYTDLTRVFPFIDLQIGNVRPDLPRNTEFIPLAASSNKHPQLFEELKRIHLEDNPELDDKLQQGIHFGTYRNVTCLKNPVDMMIYQMLINYVRPTLIIEVGTGRGGSAMYLADQLRLLGGDRRIYTCDTVNDATSHLELDPMITFSSKGHTDFDPSIIKPRDRVLVIEDSSHTYENTLEVINRFAPYVTPNSYLIVEDGKAGDNNPALNGGPGKAIEEFMQDNKDFEYDTYFENFFGPDLSNCFKGFLRRKF